MNQIKTVFGFDMETDIGSWTSFYEGFKHGTPLILDVLKKHDIKATFFFIWCGMPDTKSAVTRCSMRRSAILCSRFPA